MLPHGIDGPDGADGDRCEGLAERRATRAAARVGRFTAVVVAALFLAAGVLSGPGVLGASQATEATAGTLREDRAAEIAQWIRQLGDPQYSNREKAQEELRRVGILAFDLLLAAQDDPDVEISQRARYLVRSIPVAWIQESDPAEVKTLLVNFGELGRGERRTRAQHLATIEQGAAIPALCRIVRYEPDRVLSKHAALLVMSQKVFAEEASERAGMLEAVRREIESSQRPAVEWLKTFAREVEQPGTTLSEWERITQQELDTYAKAPQQSDRDVLRDLLRWQTKLLLQRDRVHEALVNFRRTYDLIPDSSVEIHEALDWAIEHRVFAAADELAARFPQRVNSEPQLLYRLAEAQWKRGDPATADKTADAARRLRPEPGHYNEHMATAVVLYQRGLVDWSAAEYRRILQETKIEDQNSIEARWNLSDMLFDAGREREAADTLKPLVEFVEKEGKENEITQLIKTVNRGNMHYWYAIAYGKEGDRAKQVEHLRLAIEAHPANIDIIIAMHRVPDMNSDWKADVQKRIDAHLGKCRTLIVRYEDNLRQQPNRELIENELATAYNELAWLISNTVGDPQEAVRASQRSLELEPENAAYLDTLARCYYAAGDLDNAVQYQRRAVKRMPHIQIMQRQLKLFEEALRQRGAAAPTPVGQRGAS